MKIGDRIKAARKAAKLTQEQLAERSGISWGYLRQLETNRRLNPTGETLQALAVALDMTVDALLAGAIPTPDLDEPPIEEARSVGITQAELDVLQQRWAAWSEKQKRDYLRQVETAQRQQQHLRALTEDNGSDTQNQPQILTGIL